MSSEKPDPVIGVSSVNHSSEKIDPTIDISSLDYSETQDEFSIPPSKFDQFDDEKINSYYNELGEELTDYLKAKTGHGDAVDDDHELSFDVKFVLTKVLLLSDEKALEIIQKTIKDHDEDPNFPSEDWNFITSIVSGENPINGNPITNFKAKVDAVLYHFHSPYPEVRSVTNIIDDEEPIETVRSYTLGLVWLILSAGIKEFFSHRQPRITLSTSICAVLMYPCGLLWAFAMPKVNLFGIKKLPLNPGPYGFKEQMFAVLMVSTASSNVYVSYNIVTQVKFFNQKWVSFGYQFLLCLSTQFMGFSFAGILRKFVIYPSRAVWPTILPEIALNRSLLLREKKKENINGWTITRYKFFWIAFAAMFAYFWLPNYLFQALSYFNWMTWISPNNFNLAVVTGSQYGLGFNPISSFDWNIATALIYPLAVPFSTTLNTYVGTFIGGLVILGIFYSNYKWSGYLPINSNALFSNTGARYNISKVVTDDILDFKKYQEYSPPFYSAANIVVYSAFFFLYPFAFLYNGYKEWATIKKAGQLIYHEFVSFVKAFNLKQLFKKGSRSKKSLSHYDDPHSRMMSKYAEVPDWAFVITLIISIVLAIILVKVFPQTKTPVWGIFFVIGINFVFLIPFSLVYAVTGVQYGLNVLVELIVGYAIKNNGMALMTLKALGYNIDGQAENFVSAQKTAHYVKIPPRALFRAQFIGTFVQVLVFLGVVNWSLSNIEGMCDVRQPQHFTCPSERTYSSAAIFWGSIGPTIVFNGLYPVMKYAFLMGFLFALVMIALRRFTPRLVSKTFEPAIIINGILNYAPYNLSYITPSIYISYAFMHYVKRRYPAWFGKFTYVLSAALDAGVGFSALIIFFAVQYHPKDISWWGNNVINGGVEGGDGQQTLYDITLTDRGYFGPERGKYPTNDS